MGFKIRAALAFTVGAALVGIMKVKRASEQARGGMNKLGKDAKGAETAVNSAVKLSNNLRTVLGPKTGAQSSIFARMFGTKGANKRAIEAYDKDIKVAMDASRRLTDISRETRSWIKLLQGTAKKGVRANTRPAVRSMGKLKKATSSARMEFGKFFAMVGTGLAAIGAANILGDLGNLFTKSLGLANTLEAARVTFDVMLGSTEKSADLMQRISKFSAKTPFQKADIIEGSKTLLRVTRGNIDANEKLFKLSASIAAIKPGTKVAGVSEAIAKATIGSFRGLEQFGLVLQAEQFKKIGTKGGEDYSKAVIAEIERQFTRLTGGRDLVGLLSATITGKVSTLQDNVENLMLAVGESLTKELGLKPILDRAIEDIELITDAVRALLFGEDFPQGIPPGLFAIATFITNTISKITRVRDIVVKQASTIWKWFNRLSEPLQKLALSLGVVASTSGIVVGILTPVALALSALFTLAAAPIAGVLIPALKAAAAATLVFLPLVLAIGAGFTVFRLQGESIGDTLKRLGGIVLTWGVGKWSQLKAILHETWIIVRFNLQQAWISIKSALEDLKPALAEVLVMFRGSTTNMTQAHSAGRLLGKAISFLIRGFAGLLIIGLKLTAWFLKRFKPTLNAVGSDIWKVTKAFFDLISGVGSAKANLKIMMLGIGDIILSPFRAMLAELIKMIGKTFFKIADRVKPLSSRLANEIKEIGRGFNKEADELLEGFLRNRSVALASSQQPFQIQNMMTATATLKADVNIDGEKVGEATAQADMRARNAGRGGDPMLPEEMGFVLESGKIRTVDVAEVAGRA